MNSDKATANASANSVIVLPVRHNIVRRDPRPDLIQASFSVSGRHTHKQNVQVESKEENNASDLEVTRHNFPGEYNSWRNMKYRCKKRKGTLHPAFETFAEFMRCMGPKPHETSTLDRTDHKNPEYSPATVRWASKSLQTWNRSNTRWLTDNTGRCLPVTEWARKKKISPSTIRKRLERGGWSQHDAIHKPKGSRLNQDTAPPHPSANCDELVRLFEQRLREVHHQGFICTRPKDRKMLKEIARCLEVGGVPSLPALALCLQEWREFSAYAEKKYGAFKPPEIPNTEYLSRSLMAIGNYYLQHPKEKEEAAKEQQRQLLLEEQRKQEEVQWQRRREFIDDYLKANPEYKQLNDKLKWLDSVKDRPDYGMDRQHFIDYAPFWFRLNGDVDGEATQESCEQWADCALARADHKLHKLVWAQAIIDSKEEFQVLEKGLRRQAEEVWNIQQNQIKTKSY